MCDDKKVIAIGEVTANDSATRVIRDVAKGIKRIDATDKGRDGRAIEVDFAARGGLGANRVFARVIGRKKLEAMFFGLPPAKPK